MPHHEHGRPPEIQEIDRYIEEQLAIQRLETQRIVKERQEYLEYLKQLLVTTYKNIDNRKQLNLFENYPRVCKNIALWIGGTTLMVILGLLIGSRLGSKAATDDGVQKGYRMVAHASVDHPERWRKYVHDVTGKWLGADKKK